MYPLPGRGAQQLRHLTVKTVALKLLRAVAVLLIESNVLER